MRSLREAKGLRQETLAVAAGTWGLPWTQATVAAIELGHRALSVGEFLKLPVVFTEAGVGGVELEDFIPAQIHVKPKRAVTILGEAERQAARKLGWTPERVVAGAVELWGCTLSQERDRRIGDRAGQLEPRSLQAVRARVTRRLVRDLAARRTRRDGRTGDRTRPAPAGRPMTGASRWLLQAPQ